MKLFLGLAKGFWQGRFIKSLAAMTENKTTTPPHLLPTGGHDFQQFMSELTRAVSKM